MGRMQGPMLAPTIAPIHRRGGFHIRPCRCPVRCIGPGGVRDAAPLQLYGKYTTTFLKVRPHKGDYQYANHNF